MPDNMINRARQLRRAMTDAERLLWRRLRDRQMNSCKFRRQVPLGRYVVDFVCFEKGLVVELDGGQHAEQEEYDAARTAWLESQGFKVLRFWNHEVMLNVEAVEEVIYRELTAPEGRG